MSTPIKDCRLTIDACSNNDLVKMSFTDSQATVEFFEVEISPLMLIKALGRLALVKCATACLSNVDKVGMKMEMDHIVFEMPEDVSPPTQRQVAKHLAIDNTPEGWEPDLFFGARESFFTKDGKQYARCIIRRWVEPTE